MFGKLLGPGFKTIPLPEVPAPSLDTIPNDCTIADPVGLVDVQPPPTPTNTSVPAGYPVVFTPSIRPNIIPKPASFGAISSPAI